MKQFKERFEDKYIPEPNSGCWLWNTTVNNAGYGIVKNNNKVMVAHRASYELYCEPIPDGMIICHKCDNRSCVNPDHLFVGSYKDNTHDMISKGRRYTGDRSVIMRGNTNSQGSKNASAKLTEKQVIAIYRDTRTAKEIAADYSINANGVYRIKNGTRWKHITGELI